MCNSVPKICLVLYFQMNEPEKEEPQCSQSTETEAVQTEAGKRIRHKRSDIKYLSMCLFLYCIFSTSANTVKV